MSSSRLTNQQAIERIQELVKELNEVIGPAPEPVRRAAESELRAIFHSLQPAASSSPSFAWGQAEPSAFPFMQSPTILRDILESIYDGFFALDREWRYVYINRRAAEPLGYSPEELVGKNLWEVFPRLRGTTVEEHYRKAMEQGVPAQYRVQGVYSNRWYDISVYPSQFGISVFTVDRTEQVETHIELGNRAALLHESEERLRMALEGANQGIWDWDLKTDQLVWDARCKEIFGLPPYMPVTYTWFLSTVHQEDREHIHEAIQIATRDHTPYIAEHRFYKPDGSTHWVLSRGRVFYDAEGKPERMSGTAMDVTKQRQAEQMVNAIEQERREYAARVELQQRMIEQREKDRQDIARDIHDGPVQMLSSTIFNIQFAKEAFPDPALNRELDLLSSSIKSAVQELRRVIHDLRPPSVLRFGLASSIEFHAEDFRERHPDIHLDLLLDEDRGRLSEQACLTLFRIYQETLTNLARDTNPSKIWVRSEMDDQRIVLEIRDNSGGSRASAPAGGDSADLQTTSSSDEISRDLENIAARAEAIRGTFAIEQVPGKGVVLKVTAPLEQ